MIKYSAFIVKQIDEELETVGSCNCMRKSANIVACMPKLKNYKSFHY